MSDIDAAISQIDIEENEIDSDEDRGCCGCGGRKRTRSDKGNKKEKKLGKNNDFKAEKFGMSENS